MMLLFNLNADERLSLKKVYFSLALDEQQDIPFRVWLIENPNSCLALPGTISLREHDL